MTVKHALALLAAAWLLAGCASFGEGLARGVMAQSEEPAEDTRLCEVSGPAFTGILPMLERQDGLPAARPGGTGPADPQGDHGARGRHPRARLQRPPRRQPRSRSASR